MIVVDVDLVAVTCASTPEHQHPDPNPDTVYRSLTSLLYI
jgi:hypothetical protein